VPEATGVLAGEASPQPGASRPQQPRRTWVDQKTCEAMGAPASRGRKGCYYCRRDISIERTMSSSTIERCSSGSITTSSAFRISSRLGIAGHCAKRRAGARQMARAKAR
jgi:hypothetical protein